MTFLFNSSCDHEESARLLDNDSVPSSPERLNNPSFDDIAESTSLNPITITNTNTNSESGMKSNLSPQDVFLIANQSVDELLNEIKSKSNNEPEFCLPELSHSPVTQPLHLENDLLEDFDVTPTDIPKSESIPLIREDVYHINGPRKYINNSPVKIPSPKKRVKIEMSSPKIMEYEPELDGYSSEEISIKDSNKVDLCWNKIPIRLTSKTEQDLIEKLPKTSKPLPAITQSDSNFSIKSMPNLVHVPESPTESNQDDSDETIAPSPATQRRSFSSEKLNNLTEKISYDHETYLQNMKRGELDEPLDIKKSRKSKQQLEDGIIKQPDSKPGNQISMQELTDGFQTSEENIKRNDSIKSVLSIAPEDCKLETRVINKSLVDEKSGADAEDKDVENENKASTDLDISDDESPSPKVGNISINNNSTTDRHQRSTSLSEIVGRFFRSMSSNSISTRPESESGNTQADPINPLPTKVYADTKDQKKRMISAQSIATTITESGFVSADEGYDGEINRNIQISEQVDPDETMDTVVIGQDNNNNKSISSSISNESSIINTVEGEKGTKIYDPIEFISVKSNKIQETNSDVSSEVTKVEKFEDTGKGDVLEADKLSGASHEQPLESQNSSFDSDKFVLHVPFEDNIYLTEFDEFNEFSDSIVRNEKDKYPKGRVISSESAPRNEVLEIWSKQRSFKLPVKKHQEFDSISAPIKSYVVNEHRPKAVKVISNRGTARISSDDYTPSNWVMKRLEVLPSGILNKDIIHVKSASVGSPIRNLIYPNKVSSENESNANYDGFIKNISKARSSDNDNSLNFEDSVLSSNGTTIITKLSPLEVEPKVGAKLTNLEFESSNDVLPTDRHKENTVPSIDYDLEDNLNLSNVLDDVRNCIETTDTVEDSLIRAINEWDPDQSDSSLADNLEQDLKNPNDNRTVLKKLWNNNVFLDEPRYDDSSKHLSANDMETFLNHKRIISDEFQIKKANATKVQLEPSYLPQVEQQAQMMNTDSGFFNNENMSVTDVVPELDIPSGINGASLSSQESLYSHRQFIPREPCTPRKQKPIQTFKDNKEQETQLKVTRLSPTHNCNPTAPFSPAHQKIQVRLEKQKQMKVHQQQHMQLQHQLQQSVHKEALEIAKSAPSTPAPVLATAKASINPYTVNEDTIDDIYEEFTPSPSKIPAMLPTELFSAPSTPLLKNINNNSPLNPFESSVVKPGPETTTKNVCGNSLNNMALNPFDVKSNSSDTSPVNKVKKLPVVQISHPVKSDPGQKNQEERIKLINDEQGRFFLRILDLKGLKLPDVEKRHAKFQILLDNGIHCLKTDFFSIEKQKMIPINKEFELIVTESLDIVITLKMKYEKPKGRTVEVSEKHKVKSKSALGRMFGKKELKVTKKMVTQPPEYDALADYIAVDGSFAKVKFSFDEFRKQITGKPREYSLNGYNEWKNTITVKGNVKTPKPLSVCQLDFNMLFIPRTSELEVLPNSIANALAQVQQSKKLIEIMHEGSMFQEGGDLKTWTKRFYKLEGYDLFAYNEDNKKLKAKINLRKIINVSTPGQSGDKHEVDGDEGATTDSKRVFNDGLILNNGFRVKFYNGETIDFGCDTHDETQKWVTLLQELILKSNYKKQPWINLMLQSTNKAPASKSMVV